MFHEIDWEELQQLIASVIVISVVFQLLFTPQW